jgi:hypothetical protein
MTQEVFNNKKEEDTPPKMGKNTHRATISKQHTITDSATEQHNSLPVFHFEICFTARQNSANTSTQL